MTLGIMQPYFVPYVGYWQLINACDLFILYDNVEYTKKGWINRNRIMLGDSPGYITIALKNDSDYLNINERFVSENWDKALIKRQIENNYLKHKYFEETMPLINDILNCTETNLFWFVSYSIMSICKYLEIKTPIFESSYIQINHELKGKEKVIALCKEMNCNTYINAIGGQSLYDKSEFEQQGIDLKFLQTNVKNDLSIIDVLMNNGKEKTKQLLNEFQLV